MAIKQAPKISLTIVFKETTPLTYPNSNAEKKIKLMKAGVITLGPNGFVINIGAVITVNAIKDAKSLCNVGFSLTHKIIITNIDRQ